MTTESCNISYTPLGIETAGKSLKRGRNKDLSVFNDVLSSPPFSSGNREPLSCALMASDLHWGKPCFPYCALGATWQDQCLCGCKERPHGRKVARALEPRSHEPSTRSLMHNCSDVSHTVLQTHITQWDVSTAVQKRSMNTEEAV